MGLLDRYSDYRDKCEEAGLWVTAGPVAGTETAHNGPVQNTVWGHDPSDSPD
jgi:hypothetical protein